MIGVTCIVAFALTAFLSYTLAPWLIRFAYQAGLLDRPSERKRHLKPVPFLGGLTIFISFWTVIALGLFGASLISESLAAEWRLPWIIADISPWIHKIVGVFLGSLVVLVVGLLDDRFSLSPFIKFLGQSAAAIILLKIGLQVNLVEDLGWFGYLITYTWIVLLMNAFNFIDSIDGHCLGVALISGIIFFFLTQIIDQQAVALLVITFVGALLGFFPYNFKPARSFLGDNGSLLIGYMLSVITLLCRYNVSGDPKVTTFIPILMFGVPIYDTVSVVFVRLIRGIAPWKGDRNHLAHRLVRLGMGERAAALSSYFIATTLGLVALLSTQVETELGSLLVVLIFLSVISIIALFEYYAALRIRLAEKLALHHRRRRDDIRKAEDRF